MTMSGAALEMNSTKLRTNLAMSNVTVLTSSSDNQVSREDTTLQHGVFTQVLLDALSDPAADINQDGLINPNGLGNYIKTRVESLTKGAQSPGMEIRYGTTVFALRIQGT